VEGLGAQVGEGSQVAEGAGDDRVGVDVVAEPLNARGDEGGALLVGGAALASSAGGSS